ncbi:MAG: FAD-dependent thymidylate synthase [Clostridia bacterium]|nr:FAD-dependent thymidylate synthase [Clostridia bacterium]
MNIKMITCTKGDTINLGGKLAGICYMPDNFETLNNEDINKTINRAKSAMENVHHSVFEHSYITLYLENIPKLFAMLLNNEKVYTTSEKSARYTKMELVGKQKQLYDKWVEKLCVLIENRYGNQQYFDEKRIKKLAMENARYFTSVMTPTSMAYTVSFRQLNYLCGWLKQFETSTNPIYKMLSTYASEFVEIMSARHILVPELMEDGKNREFS